MSGYWALMRRPGAGVPWFTSFVARVVLGMAVLSIVLLVRRAGHPYGIAGLAAGLYSVGTAVGSPLWGRVADRRGSTRLLQVLAIAYGTTMVAMAVATTRGAGTAVVVGVPLVAGFLFPPVSAVARTVWRRLYGRQLRDRAFALDSVTVELGFVLGPIVAAALIDGVAAWLGVVLAAVLMPITSIGFARSGAVRAMRGGPSTVQGGAMRVPAVVRLALVSLFVGACFGTVDILAPATAEANGVPHLSGVVFSAFAAGSALGGLAYGMRSWPLSRPRRLVLLTGAMAVAFLLVALTLNNLVWFAIAAFACGLLIAPITVTIFALVDDVTPQSVVTEALSWTLTAVTVGAAVGSSVAGQLVERVSRESAVVAGAVMLVVATLVARASQTLLLDAAEDDDAPVDAVGIAR